MNRRVWIAIVVVVVAAGAFFFVRGRKARAAEYRTEALARGDIVVRVSATGSMKPVTQVEVGSQVSGTVQSLHADFNSRVSEGDLLLQLEPSTFRAQLSQARANEMKAQVALDDAERALRRAEEMREQQLVSEEALENAESAKRQAQASLQQTRAARELAEANLRYTTIRAPLSGIVVSRSVDVGQTVAASLQAPKLFVIANDLTEMQVETQIDEADIGRIREGMEATFTVDAYPEEMFHGEVAQVRFEPIEAQNVITYTTIIRVKNPDLKLKPGMTANVTIVVARQEDVLKVPNAALRFRPKDAGKNGAARPAPAGTMQQGGRTGGDGAAAGPARPIAGAGDGAAGGRGDSARAGARGMRATGDTSRVASDREGPAQNGGGEGPAGMGVVYVLQGKSLEPRRVRTGLSDGSFTAVYPAGDDLAEGEPVVTGIVNTPVATTSMPPGMGGPRGGRR